MAKTDSGNNKLAVLIDADNVPARVIAGVMREVANYGTASVRRIYGDWTSPNMKSWRECLIEHSLTPIQQFAYTTGKNATDGAMIIDAMDLLYTGRFTSFCLVSSDSDFRRLAERIREQGISVYGFGHRRTTNQALVVAYDSFVYFDVLDAPAEDQQAESREQPADFGQMRPTADVRSLTGGIPTAPRSHASISGPFGPGLAYRPSGAMRDRRPLDGAALSALTQAISTSSPFEDDWVNLATVGDKLPRMSPDLVPRNYGCERLKDFVAASDMVEIRMKPMGSPPPVALVRLKELPSITDPKDLQSEPGKT